MSSEIIQTTLEEAVKSGASENRAGDPRPRALYLRGERVKEIRGGADLVSRSVLRMLKHYFAGAVEECYLDEEHGGVPGRAEMLASATQGLFLPYGRGERKKLSEKAQSIQFLFVDQSVYGLACRDAKRANPDLRAAVLFHNVEKTFYLDRVVKKYKAHNLVLLPAIARAERSAVSFADLIIVLSERDRGQIVRMYGREPDLIMPTVLEDEFCGYDDPCEKDAISGTMAGARADQRMSGLSMLFVGSAFPPNLDGVRWFAKKVLPSVNGTLTLVGRGFEKYAAELAGPKLRIVGSVESTAEWYRGADCVVSPIFWGGGIKVKTAEAFMHGKIVVGTDEAFEGYDREAAGGILSNSAEEFIASLRAIHSEKSQRDSRFSERARQYFIEHLSFEAQYQRFSASLDRLFGRPTPEGASNNGAPANHAPTNLPPEVGEL